MNSPNDYNEWLHLGPRKPSATVSPFYSRVYAGYTSAQLESIVSHVTGDGGRRTVFDPMAGQAFGLSTLSWFGHSVRINDINPAPLLLAWLRSGAVLGNLVALAAEFKDWLSAIRVELDAMDGSSGRRVEFVTAWLSDGMRRQLEAYGELATDRNRSIELSRLFDLDSPVLFRLSMAVLAARRIACYMPSDNRTWLKPGGLDNKPTLSQAILDELDVLLSCQLSLYSRQALGLFPSRAAKLDITCADVAHSALSRFNENCIGVTSPPYANRLDYSVMWAPELWVISTTLSGIDRDAIKRNQIGTAQVKMLDAVETELAILPESTQVELLQIKESSAYASRSYYHPFFCRFALDLHSGMQHAINAAPNASKWLVFIRDTTRKDVLFSSHAICESVMDANGYSRMAANDLQIVRNHVGLRRRSKAQSAVYGLAQREWWLVFERHS